MAVHRDISLLAENKKDLFLHHQSKINLSYIARIKERKKMFN